MSKGRPSYDVGGGPSTTTRTWSTRWHSQNSTLQIPPDDRVVRALEARRADAPAEPAGDPECEQHDQADGLEHEVEQHHPEQPQRPPSTGEHGRRRRRDEQQHRQSGDRDDGQRDQQRGEHETTQHHGRQHGSARLPARVAQIGRATRRRPRRCASARWRSRDSAGRRGRRRRGGSAAPVGSTWTATLSGSVVMSWAKRWRRAISKATVATSHGRRGTASGRSMRPTCST